MSKFGSTVKNEGHECNGCEKNRMPKTAVTIFFFEIGIRPILPKPCEEKEYVQRC